MTRDVVTLSPELSVRDAMELFATQHLSGAPVTSGERIMGVVSTTDLLGFAASLPGVPRASEPDGDPFDEIGADAETWVEEDGPSTYFTTMWSEVGPQVDERMRTLDGPEWNVLEEHTVAEVMTPAPILHLPPSALVHAAAAYMGRAGVHRLLVVERDRLVGIVTTTDIARAVADQRLIVRRFVFR